MLGDNLQLGITCNCIEVLLQIYHSNFQNVKRKCGDRGDADSMVYMGQTTQAGQVPVPLQGPDGLAYPNMNRVSSMGMPEHHPGIAVGLPIQMGNMQNLPIQPLGNPHSQPMH